MRHSHVVTAALFSWCWRSRIILMTLLQVCAASLLFSDTSTMIQRLRSIISTIVDTPETLFQQIPFCHTLQSCWRPRGEGEGELSMLARENAIRRRRTCRKRLLKNWWGSLHPRHQPNFGRGRSPGRCFLTRLGKKRNLALDGGHAAVVVSGLKCREVHWMTEFHILKTAYQKYCEEQLCKHGLSTVKNHKSTSIPVSSPQPANKPYYHLSLA